MEHLHRDARVLVEHVLELRRTEDEATHRRRGLHGRGPRPVVEESDLPEELPRPERAPPLGRIDVDPAVNEDEELAPALALLDEDLSGGEIDLVDAAGDELELLVGAAEEERDRLQPGDARIGHGGGASRSPARGLFPPPRAPSAAEQ